MDDEVHHVYLWLWSADCTIQIGPMFYFCCGTFKGICYYYSRGTSETSLQFIMGRLLIYYYFQINNINFMLSVSINYVTYWCIRFIWISSIFSWWVNLLITYIQHSKWKFRSASTFFMPKYAIPSSTRHNKNFWDMWGRRRRRKKHWNFPSGNLL